MYYKKRHSDLKIKIDGLLNKLPEENSTYSQLENHAELHKGSCDYLDNKSHRLAFIGNVGAGKTTSICHLLGLLNDEISVLSTGSGRTTLCEVEIKAGDNTSIEVLPCSIEEVNSYLSDFALYLKSDNDSFNASEEEGFKLSAEVERALRNMLDLKKSRSKAADGKRVSIDAAAIFADKFECSTSLLEAFKDKIDLDSRNQNTFYKEDAQQSNKWLHNTFKSINSATHPKVGLAKKIILVIPYSNLETEDISLTVVDTKGVDQTVNRIDLDLCITNDRVVSVLCTRFNDAPDKTTVGVLDNALRAGLKGRLQAETVVLVLDREGEANDVIDVDEAVGDKIEGREIRGEQVYNDLSNKLKLEKIDIKFFDAKSDDPQLLFDSLVKKISGLREIHEERLQYIELAVKEIEEEMSSQTAKQAKKSVLQTLEPWLKKSQACSPSLNEFFLPLVSSIGNSSTYAASVRASVNRRGDWYNLDYYQELALAAREQSVEQLRPLQDELLVLLSNMLSQNDLQPAYSLLKQLKNTTDKRLNDLYQKILAKGRSAYEGYLKLDDNLWVGLSAEWGKGSGYKDRISNQTHGWFKSNDYVRFEKEVSEVLVGDWVRYVDEVKKLIGAIR